MIDNKKKNNIIKCVSEWMIRVYQDESSWKSNNLHIDEIHDDFSKRISWYDYSLYCFNVLNTLNEIYPKGGLIPFLHIDLKYSNLNSCLTQISEEFIQSEINEYTPPSLNFCDDNYYTEFYLKNLSFCKFVGVKKEFNDNIKYYFRTYFDTSEDAFSREIYIFGSIG